MKTEARVYYKVYTAVDQRHGPNFLNKNGELPSFGKTQIPRSLTALHKHRIGLRCFLFISADR